MRKTLAEKARLGAAIVLVGVMVFSSLFSLTPNQRLTVVSTISTARADPMQTALRNQVLNPAVNYLCDNYNKNISLICNSPDPEFKNTYYIYSDNYLASLVLLNYGQSTHDPNLTRIAENITNAMQNYTSDIDSVNQYMVLTEAHTVNVSAFDNSTNLDLPPVDGAEIKTTQNNQGGSLDPRNYTDIAFLQAVYYHELEKEIDAMTFYLDGVRNYDGKGFKDNATTNESTRAFTGNYETYKLALYIYASKLLGQDYDLQAFYTLQAMQQPNGGFATFYDSSLQVTSGTNGEGTNTETTSLAVLALILQSPGSNSHELTYILLVAGALGTAIILVGVSLKIVRRRLAAPKR